VVKRIEWAESAPGFPRALDQAQQAFVIQSAKHFLKNHGVFIALKYYIVAVVVSTIL
jgi:hypothetical protein